MKPWACSERVSVGPFLLDRASLWNSLSIASLIIWNDLAFRIEIGNLVTLPLPFLNYPRSDLGWLCALAAMFFTATATITVKLVSVLRNHRLPIQRSSCIAVLIATALLCALGTALVQAGKSSVGLTVVGGLTAGCGFSLLCISLLRVMCPADDSKSIAGIACAGLGISCIVRLLLLTFSTFLLQGIICLLPLLPALFATLAARDKSVRIAPPQNSEALMRRSNSQSNSHLTVVVFCWLGIGLYLGIIGFANDTLHPSDYLVTQFLAGILGSLLACLLLMLSMRPTPDGPYVLAPILLGSTALIFITTIMSPGDPGAQLAHIVGKMTDDFVFALTVCVAVELQIKHRFPHGDESTVAVVHANSILALSPLALLIGILAGGILMSTAGLSITSSALVAISLVYGALLSLGLSVQQRTRDHYVIVRNQDDMVRIAEAQATCIARELETLTPRETEILLHLLQHQNANVIAERLGISRNTVRSHIAHIYDKVGVSSRQQLVDLAATKTISI